MAKVRVEVKVQQTGDPETVATVKGDLELAGWGAPVRELSDSDHWHLEYALEVDGDG